MTDPYWGLSELYREQGNMQAAREHLQKGTTLGDQAALSTLPYRMCLAQERARKKPRAISMVRLDLLNKATRLLYVRGPVPDVRQPNRKNRPFTMLPDSSCAFHKRQKKGSGRAASSRFYCFRLLRQKEINPYMHQPSRSLTLAQYVRRRTGVPLGHSDSLRNMLHRSLGASSFAGFWQYWNPIWGYGLGRYVYSPLQRVLPSTIAFVLTFVISGGIHDLATMAVRWSGAFLFTPWFFFLGVGSVLGRALSMDLSRRPWVVRAGVNLIYTAVCLGLTFTAKRAFMELDFN